MSEGSQLKLDAHFINCGQSYGQFPEGLIVLSLLDAAKTYPELVAAPENLTGNLIYVPQQVKIEKPIVIYNHAAHNHILIVCDNDAVINIIEDFTSSSNDIHNVTEIKLAPLARCKHLVIQRLAAEKLHSQVRVEQQNNTIFESFLLQKGASLSEFEIRVNLCGENAQTNLSGVFRGNGKQIHKQTVNVNHLVPNCHSSQLFRGILDDHAQGFFYGEVEVFKNAIKTQAHQSNKNLLLSKYAQMTTCPQLQIYADDVICTHGATVGQLEDDALFYLQSRGIEYADAKNLLVEAFMQEPITSITNGIFKQCCLENL